MRDSNGIITLRESGKSIVNDSDLDPTGPYLIFLPFQHHPNPLFLYPVHQNVAPMKIPVLKLKRLELEIRENTCT